MKLVEGIRALAGVFLLGFASLAVADEVEPVYGSQLMTEQERMEHRDRMRSAESWEEREQIRSEHHERMRLRAEEKGVTLPDNPPVKRGHMNQYDRPDRGQGMGYGKNR